METQRKDKRLSKLFLTFMKIGAFTFGGGYAMIPLIEREVIETHEWISEEELMDIIAIAESTPGPAAINLATFVGYKTAGGLGAFLATLGVVLPSFCIIFGIASGLKQFEDLKVIQYAFNGIRVGVFALILKALCRMFHKCEHDKFAYVIMGSVFILATFFKVNILLILAGCACIGLGSSYIKIRRSEKS